MEHFYQDIEGWFDFEDLYREAVRRMPNDRDDGATMVEVGVYKGRSCFFLAVEAVNSGKPIWICAVDKFDLPATAMREGDGAVSSRRCGADDFRALLTAHRLEDTVHMFVAPSIEAARHSVDESIDFVFLDAEHAYASVKADIAAWWPKIKPGGILAGHDFAREFPGVEQAVREFVSGFPLATKLRIVPPRSWWIDKV